MFNKKFSNVVVALFINAVLVTAGWLWLPTPALGQVPTDVKGTLTDINWNLDSNNHSGGMLFNINKQTILASCIGYHVQAYNNDTYVVEGQIDDYRILALLNTWPMRQDIGEDDLHHRQRAIWYYTDGRSTSDSVSWDIINAIAKMDPNKEWPAPPVMTFTPSHNPEAIGQAISITIKIMQDGKPFAYYKGKPVVINLSTDFGVLSTKTVTIGSDGTAVFTITSNAIGKATITANTIATYPAGMKLRQIGNHQPLVTGERVELPFSGSTVVRWEKPTIIKDPKSGVSGRIVLPDGKVTLLKPGEGLVWQVVGPGSYTISEVAPDTCSANHFRMGKVDCVDQNGQPIIFSPDLANYKFGLSLKSGQIPFCTIRNDETWIGYPPADKGVCLPDMQTVTSTFVIDIPATMEMPAYIQIDTSIVNSKLCPSNADICQKHNYKTIMITQTGRITLDIPSLWPGIQPDDEVVEIHIGVNVLDKNGNVIHCGIGQDIFWYPYICPAPKRQVKLNIDAPATIPFSSTVYIPVWISGTTTAEDIRGGQFAVESADPTIISLVDGAVKLENFLPADSYSDIKFTDSHWNVVFMATLSPTAAISGSGKVVMLPVVGLKEGCTTLRFADHKLSNSVPELITHTVNEPQICVVKMGQVTGNAYLEWRKEYANIVVNLSDGKNSYTTTTDSAGNFTLANVPVGDYQATFEYPLFVKAVRSVKVIEGVTQFAAVGLWIGDLDQNGQVTARDQKILSTAIYPVNNPAFDLNKDGKTDILDLTILSKNLNRLNMATTDAPKSTTRTGDKLVKQPDLVSAEAQNILRVTDSSNGFKLLTTQTATAFGVKIGLAEGVTVTEVIASPSVAGGYLYWNQIGDKLYISVLPMEGQTVAANSDLLLIHLNGNSQATIEAENVETVNTTPNKQNIYLPIIVK